MFVTDVLGVSEADYTVSLYAYLTTAWTDGRIKYRVRGIVFGRLAIFMTALSRRVALGVEE